VYLPASQKKKQTNKETYNLMRFEGLNVKVYSASLNMIGAFLPKIFYQVNGLSLHIEDGQNVTLMTNFSLEIMQ
jgi:hypothetical protein